MVDKYDFLVCDDCGAIYRPGTGGIRIDPEARIRKKGKETIIYTKEGQLHGVCAECFEEAEDLLDELVETEGEIDDDYDS